MDTALAINLATLPTADGITRLSDIVGSTSIGSPHKDAIASTVLTLTKLQRQVRDESGDDDGALLYFLPNHLLLIPDAESVPSYGFLRNLCSLANDAAQTLSCSSILAGQGSESDDNGDVVFWLGKGDFGPGNERKVLDVLKLTPWLEQGAKISGVQLSRYDNCLPSTLSGDTSNPEIQALIDRGLGPLSDKYCFRVSSPSTAPLVLFFLVGSGDRDLEVVEWGGLLGIGIWSDLESAAENGL